MHLTTPISDQPHYGEHLGDVEFWSPYVIEALARHDLPNAPIEAPIVGTFPTFLSGDVVVKLFGDTFDGPRSFVTELAMCELLDTVPGIPTPGLVASGHLFDPVESWSWPYLITERLAGTPLRDVPDGRLSAAAADHLGGALARLHALAVPTVVASRDLLPRLRAEAPRRQRRFGLPGHLAEEVADFLADASTARVLVHADVTADHVFIDAGGLAGIIDWGDAITADPWYELVALRFDALRAEPALFDVVLDAYGWPDTTDFPIRALQGVLEFQFDVIGTIAKMVDLPSVPTLTELAHRLFDRPSM